MKDTAEEERQNHIRPLCVSDTCSHIMIIMIIEALTNYML